jgi:hypothetical protein
MPSVRVLTVKTCKCEKKSQAVNGIAFQDRQKITQKTTNPFRRFCYRFSNVLVGL